MSATFIDYTIAVGLLFVVFVTIMGVVTNFTTNSQTNIELSTLNMQALSLQDLADREYAFDSSISGLGLAAHANAQTAFISSASLQRLSSKQYSSMKEDFDFRIQIIDSSNTTAFSYGPAPQPTNVVILRKPVVYESGAVMKTGTFVIEVW